MDQKFDSIYDYEKWDRDLNNEEKYVYSLIMKGHNYYRKQDVRYKWIVRVLKVVVLLFSLASTIVLGLKGIFTETCQVNIGLILSAIISFATGISAYFNFEKYWMRNIKCHIRYNIIRDSFVFDIKKSDRLEDDKLEFYKQKLENIQNDNIRYWQNAIDKAE